MQGHFCLLLTCLLNAQYLLWYSLTCRLILFLGSPHHYAQVWPGHTGRLPGRPRYSHLSAERKEGMRFPCSFADYALVRWFARLKGWVVSL